MMDNKASIVILAFNSQKTIGNVLDGVFNQNTNIKYDVLVIDSSSLDGTLDIARKYPVKIHIIPKEEFNHGDTRNIGASMTTAPYICYLSHDAVPTQEWLEPLIECLEQNDDAAGAYSRQLPREDAPLVIKRAHNEEWCYGSEIGFENNFPDLNQRPSEIYKSIFFTDVSSCLKRAIWEKHPFRNCETAEDILWASDVLKAGYTTLYQPKSLVVHSHIRNIKKHFMNNLNHAKTMKKLIIIDDIFSLHTNLSATPEYQLSKNLHKLTEPLNLSSMIYLMINQIFTDCRYIINYKQIGIYKRIWNLGYGLLWQLASALGNYIGYKCKIKL
jgi:rhamnosyltransferase